MNLPEVFIREYRTMPEIPRMEVSIGSGKTGIICKLNASHQEVLSRLLSLLDA